MIKEKTGRKENERLMTEKVGKMKKKNEKEK